ncbi:protein phosphatase methylesterase 1-like isoform X2 [Varroa destructor]|uniref:Protein phosphatase methylesterase 1 n=1 Tax=Varroa destructor TaxID=109461 RepID=A0A7M7KBX6_VARDE|nr:protein phosphatase methylesterase 1-like isoform X2 [Varroa destructor]
MLCGMPTIIVAEIVSMVECSVVAIDLRGHGESTALDETDLSVEAMTHDIGRVYQQLYESREQKPPVILIGHSMGGALAVHVAAAGCIPEVSGIVVIDVVEGTALDALQSMQAVLRARPRSFHSLDYAVEWSCRSGQTKNINAAKVSMPAMLKRISDGVPATKLIKMSKVSSPIPTTNEVGNDSTGSSAEAHNSIGAAAAAAVIPEDRKADFNPVNKTDQNNQGFTWRIDLSRTEPYWSGWFRGLSSSFLAQSCAKLLLLAGIDRLDRDLTIGQMQGKFQTQVLPKVGHAVHEDAPVKVAEAISSFLVRNKLCEKIGDFSPPSVCC